MYLCVSEYNLSVELRFFRMTEFSNHKHRSHRLVIVINQGDFEVYIDTILKDGEGTGLGVGKGVGRNVGLIFSVNGIRRDLDGRLIYIDETLCSLGTLPE